MSDLKHDIAAALTEGVTAKMRDVTGNVAILAVVALLALTAWVACMAGLVVLLAPIWGMAAALFLIALLVIVMALILLAILKRRARLQRVQAEIRKAQAKRNTQAALLGAVPTLLRGRSSAMIIASGLTIGAMILSVLKSDGDA